MVIRILKHIQGFKKTSRLCEWNEHVILPWNNHPFVIIFGAHMNTSFIIKVKILVLIKWSYRFGNHHVLHMPHVSIPYRSGPIRIIKHIRVFHLNPTLRAALHIDREPCPWKTFKVVMWETKSQFCKWWVLKVNVNWKWIMFKDHTYIYGQSKIVGNPRSHHDMIIFLGANGNFIACHGPSFVLDPTSFWWA